MSHFSIINDLHYFCSLCPVEEVSSNPRGKQNVVLGSLTVSSLECKILRSLILDGLWFEILNRVDGDRVLACKTRHVLLHSPQSLVIQNRTGQVLLSWEHMGRLHRAQPWYRS